MFRQPEIPGQWVVELGALPLKQESGDEEAS
jgi:hypothetical protein